MNDKVEFEQKSANAVVKVFGVGGGGCNAVNRMIDEGIQGAEFWVVNTDAQVLANSKTPNRIMIGKELTRGLGAGADPSKGQEAAVESIEEIKQGLRGADLIFLASGMGGGTGTGAAPIIAKTAKEMGILTIGIVTQPFGFEGRLRRENAEEGLKELKQAVDSLIVVSNDKLIEVIGNIPLSESFKEADKVLRQGVQTITELIAIPATINLDFADVRAIVQDKGYALIGIGLSEGDNKAREAAHKAISSPLLEASISGAKHAIVNITGGKSITLYDANDAVDYIRECSGGELDIIFGVAENEQLTDQMIVTVIATGFDDNLIENSNAQKAYISRKSRQTAKPKEKQQTAGQTFFNENRGFKRYNSFSFQRPSTQELLSANAVIDKSRKGSPNKDYDDMPSFLKKAFNS